MILTPLDYARLACDTQMQKENDEMMFSRERGFNYHNGVFLSGMERVYILTGDKKYFNYIKKWVDIFIDDDGNLENKYWERLDYLQAGTLLFKLYEETNDKRYKKVLDFLSSLYKSWKTNEYGGFWHMEILPNQMWLDSIYMAGPLMVLYGLKFNAPEYFDLAHLQMKLMWDNMRDDRTGLLYHCWDASKKAVWADKKTGLAPEFWGRALGWYALTVFDLASYIPKTYEKRDEFIKNGVELINAIIDYRDEDSHKWFQIVNRTNDPNNWLETSCSCLYTYAICKGINEGYLDRSYVKTAKECYEGIIKDIRIENGKISVDEVCIGTGVLTYGEYLLRPRTTNDLHGMGVFVLMCCEYAKLNL